MKKIRCGGNRSKILRTQYSRSVPVASIDLFPVIIMDSELIAQGAEARLYKGLYLGKMCLMKERFVKNYRHPELDTRLTKDRIKAEARAIIRARSADENISGKTNVDHLVDFIGRGLGVLIAKLHSRHVIHGDLTTSNILLKNKPAYSDSSEAETQFIMIDFGLARMDSTLEDKAVDLYVLERSLLSAHSEVSELFNRIFHHYQRHYQNKNQCEQVLAKYKQVQARGRKRLMVG
ncbi:EKC/KEOPS complex subunit TP53RK isoform X2 [Monomorium pharaonis]|uniref:EKC/KEOPS complex subunit TP53RK isoform X2 n=1 Tax=Monomorium pharaonis TaxID=307658 RepID=UPI001746D522|nr:EKC/KEOPS complex subunit TP53RK isoform X2 [Monomorium pharaonis]